jgi:outer membrane protein assembly factor BamA
MKTQMRNRIVGLCLVGAVWGPANLWAQPTTRAEEIERLRREKVARLWPERESPLVDMVNGLVERGLREGVESGKGANGPQLVLGGMRSGHGMTVGVGYRRSDFWSDRLGYRATARGTIQGAFLLDFDLDFQSLSSERFFLKFYTKYESSPQMDFYGRGADSLEENRTSYLLEDFATDIHTGFVLFQNLRTGLTGGWVDIHTGSGKREGFPSSEEIFGQEDAPGLNMDTTFLRWGAFLAYDYRDSPAGPESGGFYGARFRQYSDRDLGQFSFRQAEWEFQQYVPYFNQNRVVAMRVAAVLSFESEGQQVPFYLQPTLGGNDDLRGFARYRFYDDHMIFASIEHRWHAFAGLDMALFADAGKVTPDKADLNFSDLDWSGGIGFRFRILGGVVSRIDFAGGREGFRWMWTFSDIYKARY